MVVARCFEVVQYHEVSRARRGNRGRILKFGGATNPSDICIKYSRGVYQLIKGQDTSGIGMKNFSPTYAALGDYEITKIYVEKESLEERGLTLDDLQHLVWEDEDEDWAEKDSIRLVSRAELADVFTDQDVMFNF